MESIREKIIALLMTVQREGMDKLIEWMDAYGFFTAPCSGTYHLAKEGGLAEHSLNVYRELSKAVKCFSPGIKEESIIICALLHDLGKVGDYGKPNYVPNFLKSGELSGSKPYTTNKNLLYVPHEVRSAIISQRFIELTEEEEFAILMHNGLYGDFKYSIKNNETELYMLLHFADMWASRVVEE